MNKDFKAGISPCKITDKELEQINSFTLKPLNSDEVYTFNVILCDNEIDRDKEKFSVDALEQIAKLFIGVTGIFDHNPKAENQCARIFSAAVEKVSGKFTSDGDEYVCVKAKAYMPRTKKNEDIIAEIEAGIKKEVSVSCAVSGFTCSICSSDMRYNTCSHIKGEEYNGKECYCILSDVTDAYEWSFVAIPAQMNAGVTKSYVKEFENMESCIKALKEGKAIRLNEVQSRELAEYINTLEKQASDGKIYRQQLTQDTVKFAVIAIPSLDSQSLEKMCSGVDTAELIKIKNAFKQKAGDIIPITPQLKANKENNIDNNEYKF
ncbi:MAG: hypothetical protein KBT46_08720 [Ruminococcus sp.]|nr:hypothetical protein [Candidatus Copronaster equi]